VHSERCDGENLNCATFGWGCCHFAAAYSCSCVLRRQRNIEVEIKRRLASAADNLAGQASCRLDISAHLLDLEILRRFHWTPVSADFAWFVLRSIDFTAAADAVVEPPPGQNWIVTSVRCLAAFAPST
jgi:hypothetical protein